MATSSGRGLIHPATFFVIDAAISLALFPSKGSAGIGSIPVATSASPCCHNKTGTRNADLTALKLNSCSSSESSSSSSRDGRSLTNESIAALSNSFGHP